MHALVPTQWHLGNEVTFHFRYAEHGKKERKKTILLTTVPKEHG